MISPTSSLSDDLTGNIKVVKVNVDVQPNLRPLSGHEHSTVTLTKGYTT
jgi:hypothetical protein